MNVAVQGCRPGRFTLDHVGEVSRCLTNLLDRLCRGTAREGSIARCRDNRLFEDESSRDDAKVDTGSVARCQLSIG